MRKHRRQRFERLVAEYGPEKATLIDSSLQAKARREFWRGPGTALLMIATPLLLGVSVMVIAGVLQGSWIALGVLVVLLLIGAFR